MRIAFKHAPVHKRAGVALVSVAANVLHVAFGSFGKLPLQSRREAGAAAPAQPALEYNIYNVVTAHLGKHLCKRLITVKRYILVYILRIYYAAVSQRYALLLPVEVYLVKRKYLSVGVYALLVQQIRYYAALYKMLAYYPRHIVNLYVAVERALGIHYADRSVFAQAEAAGAHHLDFLFKAGLLYTFLKPFYYSRRIGRGAASTCADKYLRTIEFDYSFLPIQLYYFCCAS